jgi:transposase InsO family protein
MTTSARKTAPQGRAPSYYEFATHRFNHRRLLEPIGNVPPAELESAYYRQQRESALAA